MNAQIIPVCRLPLFLLFLDYLVPESMQAKIKIGQLVKIPFRNQEVFGVVKSLEENTAPVKKIKEIKEIVFSKPVLSNQQIVFLQDMSEFYHVSLGFLLKTNLLPLQKNKLKKLVIKSIVKPSKRTRLMKKPSLLIYKTQAERDEYIFKNIKQRSQTLILVPEISAINKITLPKKFQDSVINITGRVSDRELFAGWLSILSGDKKIIIGTRRALFLPWFNLSDIFLDDEANLNYKSWDMAPRFHTKDASLFLAKHHGSKLHLLTHTPSTETYYFARQGVYQLNSKKMESQNGPRMIVDMREERKKRNYDVLSEEFIEQFEKFEDKGDIFIYLNRRGTASYVGCRDCGQVLKCEQCNSLYTFHEDTGNLVCHYCKGRKLMNKKCSKCHGINMAMYGAGTQLAENKIRRLIGSDKQKKIIRIDSDTDLNTKRISEKYTEGRIIIGTQLAWPHLDWQKIKLMVFLDADTSLFVPEYKIGENLWYLLRDAQYRLPKESILMIQTNHPEHMVFKSLSEPKAFYREELAQRKMLGYPPYKFLLKLFYGDTNPSFATSESLNFKNALNILTKNNKGVIIGGPFESVPEFNKGRYWRVLLLKINYNDYKKQTKLILSNLPKGWKADPNPNNILSF
ncbi:MAG: primosomal protein N' [bacterium]